MGKNTIITKRAGRLCYQVCCPRISPQDSPQERREKRRASTAARALINFRHAWQKLELILAANFTHRDLFLTLTFDDEHLPQDRNSAIREAGKFWRQLKAHLKKNGTDIRYLYNVEEMPDEPGGSRRLHLHAVITADGLTAEAIRTIWGRGQVYIESLLDGPNDSYESRARYLCKERHPGEAGRKTGLRAWIPSKNLRQPEVTTETVPDTLTVQPPPGAYVLDRREEVNWYGSYTFIKYLLPIRQKRPNRPIKTE